ncbi:MAG: DEAD/DEAH box helicase family protein [Oscillospiraceae bacterium]|nr:DEAD/DEAH box helicase family protein [Oscillospiraceae bacterium]
MKCAELEKKLRALELENARLKSLLGMGSAMGIHSPEDVPFEPSEPGETHQKPTPALRSVTKHSPPEDKITLFRSLFFGREDVFARRWQSQKTGKSGYSPACANEWKPGVCPKPKGTCGKCKARQLLPLSDIVVERHLRGNDPLGRDVVGIYPILPEDTCRFLALDFDEGEWQENIRQLRKLCEQWGIPCAIERSRSGDGAHLWLFFSEPVLCAEARKLGSALLTAAMDGKANLSLSAYDRMFPNQDTLPKGGFGNLIALPLQGMARKQGNTVFLDEAFEPYPDQWAFLSALGQLSREELEQQLHLHAHGDALGCLVQGEESEKPWEPAKRMPLNASDLPEEMEIIQSNLLYLSQEKLSPRAQNRLLRLAAFKNPEFYKAQAMRLPIFNKPRIIGIGEIRDGYLALPRGCEEALRDLLAESGVFCRFVDKRNPGRPIRTRFNGELREEQEPAAEALLRQDTGVLSAATAFGKTVVAAYLIGKRKVNTLVLVHTQALMAQWRSALDEFLTIDEELPPVPKKRGRKKERTLIGQLGGNKNSLSGIIDVALLQSVSAGDLETGPTKEYGMVIVDECHHVSSVTFERVLREVNARYVYGLSATPTRQDGHHPIVFMQCGPIRYRVDAKEQARKRSFVHYVIPRFTAYRCASAEEKGITGLYSDLADNEQRNALIVQDAKEALIEGRSPVLLTERREHVERLAALLSPHCPNIVTLYGTTSEKKRRETLEKLQSIPAEAPILVIATGKYVGEGFDYPRLDTLLLAMPISWKGRLAQYAGRLHRNYPGKEEVRIYDYVDVHVPVLEKMYQRRIKGYAAIGYHVRSSRETGVTKDLIYDGRSFWPVYCDDLRSAQKEILIVSPFMRRNRLKQLIQVLTEPIMNGVAVKAITRPPEDFPTAQQEAVRENIAYLEGYGVHVSCRSGFHQKYTVLDQETVWYGSVNFLSFGAAEESIMRLESIEIAGQLTDTVIEGEHQ